MSYIIKELIDGYRIYLSVKDKVIRGNKIFKTKEQAELIANICLISGFRKGDF